MEGVEACWMLNLSTPSTTHPQLYLHYLDFLFQQQKHYMADSNTKLGTLLSSANIRQWDGLASVILMVIPWWAASIARLAGWMNEWELTWMGFFAAWNLKGGSACLDVSESQQWFHEAYTEFLFRWRFLFLSSLLNPSLWAIGIWLLSVRRTSPAWLEDIIS